MSFSEKEAKKGSIVEIFNILKILSTLKALMSFSAKQAKKGGIFFYPKI